MSRRMHRRSPSMRLLCLYVALIVLASFAGVGYATPNRAGNSRPSSESTENTPPPGGDVAVPEEPDAPPANDDGEVAPDEQEPAADEEASDSKADSGDEPGEAALAGVPAPATTDSLPPTQQGIVPTYVDPWTNHVCSYSEFKLEGSDWHNGTFTTDSEGHLLPGGASITISNNDDYQFDFSASGVLVHHVVVKAGTGAMVYNYDPNGITADRWLYSVLKDLETSCDYLEISHVTFCYSQTPSTGHIIIRKYDDENGDDDRDGGEDWLAGFTFLLEQGDGENGPWTYVDQKTTEGMYGQADFGNMIAGWYRMTEILTPAQIAAGWAPTADNPRVFYHTGEVNGSDADEECKWFGNRVMEYKKQFKLTYEGIVPANTTFHAVFTVDGEPYDVPLTGGNPFLSQEFEFRSGAVISSVSWYATWTPEGGSPTEILLGTSAGEILDCDTVNSFTYGGKLEGYKFEDLNADGAKDSDEPGLSDWKIIVEREIDGEWYPYATKLTNLSGYYSFYGILPGHYRVTEDIAGMTDYDWVQSMPGTGFYEVDINSIMTAGGVSTACVGTVVRKDFMNWAPASLHAVKFHDLNADGEWNEGEPGLPEWIIFVDYDGDGVRDADTPLGPEPYAVTDANGECTIENIHPGTFPVREQMVAGWNQSVGGSYVVVFESRGEYGLEYPYIFGNWSTATKAGMKFHDLNADGVKDDDEPGLPGWTIYVDYNNDGVFDANEPSAVSGPDGVYMIWNIVPGTWNVREVLTGDWVQSYPAAGYYNVEFTSEMADEGNDFGNWHPGGVEGYKFNDLNVNGAYDNGEPYLAGWTIYVDLNDNGVLDAEEPSDVTDASGYYYIDGLTPGSYWIREVQQPGWTESMGDHYVTIQSNETIGQGEVEFGNWTTTGLSGYKFEDKDADGTWDLGEPVMAGVTINLTGTDVFGSPVLLSTVTDPNGYYEFTGLVPGDYVVSEVVPAGWTQSYPADGIYQVSLESGETPEESFDFGNWTFADPHGYKIHDLNANGSIDDGEPGLAGWTINLDGMTGWGQAIHMETVTDSEGRWEFTEVPPGEYVISETQQIDWYQSFPDDPGTYEMTLESQEAPEESFDFANWTTATKYGMKFFDANGDGQPREEGEIGLAGWTIFVDYNNNGVLDEGEPFDITDDGGAYMIEDIIPGMWYVREVNDDPDWMNTYPEYGYYYETFESGQSYRGNDFGNTTWVDKTFELTFETDVPSDTTFTVTFSTEFVNETPPLQEIQEPVDTSAIAIIVEDHELPLVESESGVYTATLPVWPQTVITNVEWWAGWMGEKIKLGDGAQEELIDEPMTNEFEYGADIFGSKWDDTDRINGLPPDGIWDTLVEPGMSGWQIELYRLNMDEEWVLYDAVMTTADGSYSFADVLPGTYYLGEVIPIDPVTQLPTWTQIAGPMGVGDEDFDVSDGVSTGPVDFGNYEPFGPLTLDMGLTKDVDKSTAEPGDTLVYTITYTMVAGLLDDGAPFTITDDFDENYVSVVDGAGGTVADGKITWSLEGPLAAGDSGTITYRLKVKDDMPDGVTNVDNTAVITVTGDGDPSNNSDSERVKVSVAGEPFLPFTGGEALLIFAVMSMAVIAGLSLRFRAGRISR